MNLKGIIGLEYFIHTYTDTRPNCFISCCACAQECGTKVLTLGLSAKVRTSHATPTHALIVADLELSGHCVGGIERVLEAGTRVYILWAAVCVIMWCASLIYIMLKWKVSRTYSCWCCSCTQSFSLLLNPAPFYLIVPGKKSGFPWETKDSDTPPFTKRATPLFCHEPRMRNNTRTRDVLWFILASSSSSALLQWVLVYSSSHLMNIENEILWIRLVKARN